MDRTGIGLLLVCLLCVSPCVLGQDMVNVAANATGRTCRQSSFLINRYGACNAANGNTGGTYSVTGANANCIFTAVTAYYSNENGQNVEDRTPWWQVDLGGMYPVQDITVWGRDVETHSLYPFNITVDGQQCARAVSGGRNISVTCDKVIYGQKVLLTRDHKAGPDYSLNMCELEVWVCQSGYHRVSNKICELCNTNCDRGCDRNNGRCDSCKSGYHGDQCDSQCSTIHYRCTQCTQDSTCTACSNNSQAPACTACAPNTYGENCSERCGRCKGEQPCKASTGECTGECQPGYTGTLCKTECGAGLYGAECNQTCGGCQVNTTCHHEDGHCLVGCVAEFAGLLCLQATSQENKDDGATNWVGPIVGAIVGVGLVMTISVTAAICRRRKSDSSRSGGQDRPTASPTMQDSAPTVSPEPSPLRQASSNEDHIYIDILDPDDIYDVESKYNRLSPYSNDDAHREPYVQLTAQTRDVNTPASSAD